MRNFKKFLRTYRRGFFNRDKQGNIFYRSSSGSDVYIGMKKNEAEEITPQPVKNIAKPKPWYLKLLTFIKNLFK